MLADGTLPVSMLAVAQILRGCFTTASFEVFTQLFAGMVVTRRPRTVTGMLIGAGLSQTWSHHRAHRFFSRAAWDPHQMGRVLAAAVIEALPTGAVVRVAVDDTLFRRRGKKVFAAMWTHDGSARSKEKIGYGNTWVVLAILIDLPFASRPVALPVMTRLWRGKGTPSRSELALIMVADLKQVAGQRIVQVVADAAYHHAGIATLPEGITWTTRLAANAALSSPAPPPSGKRGRPRKKGDRLGTLTQIAAGATFQHVTVQRYGQTANVRLAVQHVQWYGCFKDLPVRLILLRDSSKYYDLALITTDLTSAPEQIITAYAARWSIEVIFQQARENLGVGQARNRTAHAVERTVPFGLTSYTLTILWYTAHANPDTDVTTHRRLSPWYRTKTEPSFQNMLDTLRRVIIADQFSPGSPGHATIEEIRAVTTAWAQAA